MSINGTVQTTDPVCGSTVHPFPEAATKPPGFYWECPRCGAPYRLRRPPRPATLARMVGALRVLESGAVVGKASIMSLRLASQPCRLHAYHSPVPAISHLHHILPRSWGGTDDPSNLIPLCPTGHENVHTYLNLLVAHEGLVRPALARGFGYATRDLAHRAWDRSDPTRRPYTQGGPR